MRSLQSKGLKAGKHAGDTIDQIFSQAERILSETGGRWSDTRDEISRRVKESPVEVLAGATAIGFVLGGGLFTKMTGRIVTRVLVASALVYAGRRFVEQLY